MESTPWQGSARYSRRCKRSDLLAYHERFGIDQDKFGRQISSYELSGGPPFY
jgi:hypothetical protein